MAPSAASLLYTSGGQVELAHSLKAVIKHQTVAPWWEMKGTHLGLVMTGLTSAMLVLKYNPAVSAPISIVQEC